MKDVHCTLVLLLLAQDLAVLLLLPGSPMLLSATGQELFAGLFRCAGPR